MIPIERYTPRICGADTTSSELTVWGLYSVKYESFFIYEGVEHWTKSLDHISIFFLDDDFTCEYLEIQETYPPCIQLQLVPFIHSRLTAPIIELDPYFIGAFNL